MKLDVLSTIDSRKYPSLYQWDTQYRLNHALYQTKIDELTFHLQKSQRGLLFFGSWNYPYFYQKDLLMLELYKRKQQVGRIFPEEVNEFKAINKGISSDLNKTFNASYHIPLVGLACGSGVFAFAHIFNFQYSLRAGLVLIPIMADLAWFWSDKRAYINSSAFLEFLTEFRKAKCRIEYEKDRFDQKVVQRLRKELNLTRPLEDYYGEIVKLVKLEKGQWTE